MLKKLVNAFFSWIKRGSEGSSGSALLQYSLEEVLNQGQTLFIESAQPYKNIAFMNRLILDPALEIRVLVMFTNLARAMNYQDFIENKKAPCTLKYLRDFDVSSFDYSALINSGDTLMLAVDEEDLARHDSKISDMAAHFVQAFGIDMVGRHAFVFDHVPQLFHDKDVHDWNVLATKGARFYHLNSPLSRQRINKEAWGEHQTLHGEIDGLSSVTQAEALCGCNPMEAMTVRPLHDLSLSGIDMSGRYVMRKGNDVCAVSFV